MAATELTVLQVVIGCSSRHNNHFINLKYTMYNCNTNNIYNVQLVCGDKEWHVEYGRKN